MTSMVRIRGLSKYYGTREVLSGIDLDVAAGSVMCIIGPSGSGKSTLLSCINHLERIDAGQIWSGLASHPSMRTTQPNSPAASNSVWRSHARWRWTRS
jgi:ABC-type polar amino acid transport system ATPase subunit